jgi:hypothetical protein
MEEGVHLQQDTGQRQRLIQDWGPAETGPVIPETPQTLCCCTLNAVCWHMVEACDITPTEL